MPITRIQSLVDTPFARMRLLATAMLAVMAAAFIVTSIFIDVHPALAYVRAFAEASMVGGMADWFAVTALFRHPLGLPIPHTAIIPRSKERIGNTLAEFIRDNFLTPAVVARRLEAVDIAGAAARWLLAPAGSSRSRRGLPQLLTRVLEALDQRAIGEMVRAAAADKLRSAQMSPVLAGVVEAAIDQNRHEPVIDVVIGWAARTLDSEESTIREMVTDRTSWLLRLASVDDKLADSIVDALRRLLIEVAGNPQHPLRIKITEALRDFTFDLRHLPRIQAKVEEIKLDLLENKALGEWLDGLWNSARAVLVRAINDPEASMGSSFGEALQSLGKRLESDDALRAAINLHARRAGVGLVNDYGDSIVGLISDTISGWDAVTISDKFERAVGRDLQFIRINGTLIGGLVGLVIYAVAAAV